MNRRDFVAGTMGASSAGLGPGSGERADVRYAGRQWQAAAPRAAPVPPALGADGGALPRLREERARAGLNRAGSRPSAPSTSPSGPAARPSTCCLPIPARTPCSRSPAGWSPMRSTKRPPAFRALTANDPPYIRRESSLMTTFDGAGPASTCRRGPTPPLARLRAAHLREPQRRARGSRRSRCSRRRRVRRSSRRSV